MSNIAFNNIAYKQRSCHLSPMPKCVCPKGPIMVVLGGTVAVAIAGGLDAN
jgi:hypothetical protein